MTRKEGCLYILDSSKLVPVVSVEWLEKYQEDHFMIGQKDKDLLVAARRTKNELEKVHH